MSNNSNKRVPISKKLRFEVFKRDHFTCQYCGRMAPDVVLEVDHILPVAEGGTNDIMNLVTSCHDCNSGKGKTLLNQNDELKKQQAELKLLSERREQIQFMVEWKKELKEIDDAKMQSICDLFTSFTGYHLKSGGKKIIKNLIKRYSFEIVYDSTVIAFESYYDENDESTIMKAINYISRICYTKVAQEKNPLLKQINYINKIASNNFEEVDQVKLKRFLRNNIKDEWDVATALDCVKNCQTWENCKECLIDYLEAEGEL